MIAALARSTWGQFLQILLAALVAVVVSFAVLAMKTGVWIGTPRPTRGDAVVVTSDALENRMRAVETRAAVSENSLIAQQRQLDRMEGKIDALLSGHPYHPQEIAP